MLKAPTMHSLVDLVIRQIASWDVEGYEYSKKPREEAERLGIDWYAYIARNIEHQICLDLPKGQCWRGAGDNLHEFFKGIDDLVEKLPKPVQMLSVGVTKVMTKVATGTAQKKFGSCRTCGGSRKFSSEGKNLGRKELLN